jgi:hypothetical protein
MYKRESNECPEGFERRRVGFGEMAHLLPIGKLQSVCGLGDPIWTVTGPYGKVGELWPTCKKCLRELKKRAVTA